MEIMKQELDDPPATRQEYERRKGPVPLKVIWLCLALIVVFLLFFAPAFWLQIKGG
jgi:hypothetical protein